MTDAQVATLTERANETAKHFAGLGIVLGQGVNCVSSVVDVVERQIMPAVVTRSLHFFEEWTDEDEAAEQAFRLEAFRLAVDLFVNAMIRVYPEAKVERDAFFAQSAEG